MLIEEIEPLAERGVYLALGSFSNRPETDCRTLDVGLVDISDETAIFLVCQP